MAVPFYPPLLTVTVIQKREVTVTIQIPYVHDSYEDIIDFYELHVSGNEFGTPSKTLRTPNTVYTITGLEEYTLYTCWVAAGNEIGLGAASNSVDFTTLEDGKEGRFFCKALLLFEYCTRRKPFHYEVVICLSITTQLTHVTKALQICLRVRG